MKIKLIADIGSNHNGDLNRAKQLIKEVAEAGCWGVKFQLFKADKMYHDPEKVEELKKLELPVEWLPELSKCAEENNIKLGCTPFYLEAVDELEDYVDFYKISSFDVRRESLILKCNKKKKPVMLSLGLAPRLSSYIEKELKYKNPTRMKVLMHCVSKYPTASEDACTGRIKKLIFDYGRDFKIGYSDHTNDLYAVLSAIINGAEVIEFHYDLEDWKGAESHHGHCWNIHELNLFMLTLSHINIAESKPFHLTEKDLKMKANELGFRDEVIKK